MQGESEDTINSHQNQNHEDAIFGVSGREPLKTNAGNNEPNEISCERRTEGSGIMASLVSACLYYFCQLLFRTRFLRLQPVLKCMFMHETNIF